MACNQWGTINIDCIEGIGGVETIYVMKHTNLATVSGTSGYDVDTTGHTITQIYVASDASTDIFQEIQTTDNSSAWVENRQFEIANGSQGWETQLTYVIPKSDADTRYDVNQMVKSKCLVIVKNVDGRYYLLGKRKGGYFTGGDYASGQNLSDRNGYSLVFTSFELDTAWEISSSIITSSLVTEA